MRIGRFLLAAALAVMGMGAGAARAAGPLMPGDFADGVLRYGTFQGSGIRSDTFVLPAGGAQLTVDFKFFTSEFDPTDFNFGQNDYAMFGVFDPSQKTVTPLAGVDPVTRGVLDPNTGLVPLGTTYVSPRGDAYTYESSAIQLLVDVPAGLGGKQAYVMFGVFDSGDGLVPTGAMVDDFSQPVPGAYFSPDLGAFLGSSGGMAGYMNMVETADLPAGVELDGFSGDLPLLSTGGVAVPEAGTLGVLVVGAMGLLRRRKGLS